MDDLDERPRLTRCTRARQRSWIPPDRPWDGCCSFIGCISLNRYCCTRLRADPRIPPSSGDRHCVRSTGLFHASVEAMDRFACRHRPPHRHLPACGMRGVIESRWLSPPTSPPITGCPETCPERILGSLVHCTGAVRIHPCPVRAPFRASSGFTRRLSAGRCRSVTGERGRTCHRNDRRHSFAGTLPSDSRCPFAFPYSGVHLCGMRTRCSELGHAVPSATPPPARRQATRRRGPCLRVGPGAVNHHAFPIRGPAPGRSRTLEGTGRAPTVSTHVCVTWDHRSQLGPFGRRLPPRRGAL